MALARSFSYELRLPKTIAAKRPRAAGVQQGCREKQPSPNLKQEA